MTSRHTYLLALLLLLAACSKPTVQIDPVDRRVDSLLSLMTLEEKIGQMNQLEGAWVNDDLDGQIRAGQVGALLNVVGAEKVNHYQHIAVEQTRLGIPLLLGRDVIHGYKTIYPIPLAQGATWNPDLIREAAEMTAREATSDGVRWVFSPMVDVARDPRWGRVAEGYGEDTYLTSVMGRATVIGYQGADSLDAPIDGQHVAACVKHFAGYSASEGGRDYNTTNIPEQQLRDIYLPPFQAALRAGAGSIMCSFNDISGIPSSANRHLNIDILRNEWGSRAMLVSDWGSGSDLVAHGYAANRREAAYDCISARMEMDMQGLVYQDYLKQMVDSGIVTMEQVDDCVRSILRLKMRLGLFEHPYAESTPDFYADDALLLARRVATESTILLKNDTLDGQPLLPLHGVKRVLVCGPLADAQKEQLGTWIFDGEPEHSITPLQALHEPGTGLEVTYEPGLTYSRDTDLSGIDRVVKAAASADVILYFAGEEAILSGEARCRADITLPGAQAEMMHRLHLTGKPVVLVVMAGRPLAIPDEIGQADAVLYALHGGTMAGPALADVLTGLAVPSGRLPITMPRMVGQIPIYYNHKSTGRPATTPILLDDIPIGAPQFSIGQSSYWLETGDKPLFPFGYGLSYTTFSYGPVQIDETEAKTGDVLRISCDITNDGSRDAQEVAQLYVRQQAGECRPVRELKGFKKVSIPAGQTVNVCFELDTRNLAYWHADLTNRADPSAFQTWIAPDSRSGQPVEFTITE
ncbi:MAG: glycoside hydrolase family 3 C-terminal domain-containing protein [Paludibacteraceae bacterium]|nr:glycoside hydrolase family 3 C-terminal domain-containing protein [Paludibacteraceae bacterium]